MIRVISRNKDRNWGGGGDSLRERGEVIECKKLNLIKVGVGT